jgi:hypothetical protein
VDEWLRQEATLVPGSVTRVRPEGATGVTADPRGWGPFEDPPRRRSNVSLWLAVGLAGAVGVLAGIGVFYLTHRGPHLPAEEESSGPPQFSIEQLTQALSDEDPD